MRIEQHKEAYEEHLKNIFKSIEDGIEENQRNLGFNISQGSVELFAIFLHQLHLIEGSGDQFDHRIFKNKNLIDEKLFFDFPLKEKILGLMREIESERNVLCYGSRKPLKRVEKMVENFNKLKDIIGGVLNDKKK